VIDRETGAFISAKNFVPVTWATHIDQTTGRPVETEGARYVGKHRYCNILDHLVHIIGTRCRSVQTLA
jgi:hypothetical protein